MNFEKVHARDIARLIPHAPHSVFAHYVAMTEPGSTAFLCRMTGEWALGGPLCGRLEVPEVWGRVKTASSMTELAGAIQELGLECNIALVEPMNSWDGVNHSFDLHFVRAISPVRDPLRFVVSELSMEHFSSDRLHPEIRDLLGNPLALVRDFGDLSKFFGCMVDGVVVAVADTIVRGAGYTAIQQVFTAEAYRRLGIASALITHVADVIQGNGGVAVYVCSENNQASARTAESAGFSLASRLLNIKVGQ